MRIGPSARPTGSGSTGWIRELWHRLRGGVVTRPRAAASVALGLFVGCLPIYGLHLPLCLAVGLPLRLDVVIAYVAANISNPLVAPFLVTLEIEIGFLLLSGRHVPLSPDELRAVGIAAFAWQAAVGSIVVGACLATLGSCVTWVLVGRLRPNPDPLDAAIQRTIARYLDAPRGDRIYVTAKLRTDPIVSAITDLEGSFGRLIDIGAGRGQIGLVLLELGRAREVFGLDWDARKIEVAKRASRGDALFFEGDVRRFAFPEADTILMVDVLHYLAPDEQDVLIEQAVRSLPRGGRLLVREVEDRSRCGAWFTRLADRAAARLGYNKAVRLHYRSAGELLGKLEALALVCRRVKASLGPLSNVLIVASREQGEPDCA